MRHLLLAGVVALVASGCSDTCGLGSQLNGQTYSAFIHPIEWEFDNEEAFPGAASPANGPVELTFEWGASSNGPITVVMDGQPFDGTGIFDEIECGNFVANWGGTYLSDEGTEHEFKAAALFMYYDTFLEGQLSYAEAFRNAQNQVGAYRVPLGEIRGELKATAGATAR